MLVDPFEDISVDDLTEKVSVETYKSFEDEFLKNSRADILIVVERSLRNVQQIDIRKAIKIIRRHTEVVSRLFFEASRVVCTKGIFLHLPEEMVKEMNIELETAADSPRWRDSEIESIRFKFYISDSMPLKSFINALLELNFNVVTSVKFLATPNHVYVYPKEIPQKLCDSKYASSFDFRLFVYLYNREPFIYPDFKTIDMHSTDASAMISQIDQAVNNLETLGLYPDINKDDKWKIVASAFLDFIKHHRNYYSDLIKKS
jgi:hypothetical protein